MSNYVPCHEANNNYNIEEIDKVAGQIRFGSRIQYLKTGHLKTHVKKLKKAECPQL